MPDDHVYGVRLFVAGIATTMAGWRGSLGRCGLTLDGQSLTSQAFAFRALAEWVENDGSFGHAFGLGTMSVEEQRAVDGAGSALVLDLPVYLGASAGEVAALIAIQVRRRKVARRGGGPVLRRLCQPDLDRRLGHAPELNGSRRRTC